jgi:hypothetical protein
MPLAPEAVEITDPKFYDDYLTRFWHTLAMDIKERPQVFNDVVNLSPVSTIPWASTISIENFYEGLKRG